MTSVAVAALSLSLITPVSAATSLAAPTPAPDSTSPSGLTLRLVAPGAASVGAIVPVELWADGAAGAAAFEALASIAPEAGRIVAASSDAEPGRDDMSIGDVTGFGVIAAVSPGGTSMQADSVRLGTFDVRLDTDGLVMVDLGDAMVVDAEGAELPVGDVIGTSIAVGTSNVPRPAGTAPWALAAQDASVSAPRSDAGMSVNPGTDLEMAWESVRLDGDPCAGELAISLGGCLDIGDVQRSLRASARSTNMVTREGPTTLVVDARTDEADDELGDGVCATKNGDCTLRAAMEEANVITGPNLITFNITGAAPYRIQTTRSLPTLTDTTGRTMINGYTQPGSAPNTARRKSNARIMVEVVGAGASGHDGFTIRTGGNSLRGLSIYAFRRPIWIYRTGADARGNRIGGCFIGTDPSGTHREKKQVDFAHGIHIEQGSPRTRIGGRTRASRNVISGNGYHGIGLWHSGTVGTVIRNNIIGLSPDGRHRLKNMEHGIDINYGVNGSIIGGRRGSMRNVISGNDFNGIELSHRSATTRNVIIGNLIGTRLSGKTSRSWTGNGMSGVWIEDGPTGNIVARNVIGGNRSDGIRIINNGSNGTSAENTIRRNWIGVARTGRPLPQLGVGIVVEGTSNLIAGNVIENHTEQGITISGPFARYNTITRNRIHANGGLAIDIAPLGAVNPNDPGDADKGPNAMLNFPVLSSATTTSVQATTCAGCRVEVFAAGLEGALGTNGPAVRFLGAGVADEVGAVQVTFPARTVGAVLTATATNLTGSTSEFSVNVQIPPAP